MNFESTQGQVIVTIMNQAHMIILILNSKNIEYISRILQYCLQKKQYCNTGLHRNELFGSHSVSNKSLQIRIAIYCFINIFSKSLITIYVFSIKCSELCVTGQHT